jgi:long-chain acyl-CoA synthetase
MNLLSAFAASVGRHSHKTALYWGESHFSYPDLWRGAEEVARRLQQEHGVRPGDNVGLWLKNCPEFVASFFGILRAGGVVVPINNFLKAEEVAYILQDAGVKVLITDEELGTHERALAHLKPGLRVCRAKAMRSGGSRVAESVGAALEGAALAPSGALAVLIYTSGTTGRPKGAMLSHANLLHNVESCRIVLKTVEADRLAVLLPLFHSYMLTVGMLLPLVIGGSIVLVKSLHPVRNVLQDIMRHKATVLPAIPPFYRSLVNVPGEMKLPLRLCISGAAPLPVQILRDFEARFGIPLIEGYGLSEASPVVTKNPVDGTRKPGSIGLPIPHVEVSVQDEQGRLLGAEETGEICVRGGNVMLGYWKQPEETAKAMRNGWLLTGDVGRRDADGYYYITDRKKDMILVNGINVYPREIEEVLYQLPEIREAAVVGVPNPRKGEQTVAFVALNEGASLDEGAVRAFLRRKLADYKLPRRLMVLPALPRNAAGKVLKTSLRELAAAAAG